MNGFSDLLYVMFLSGPNTVVTIVISTKIRTKGTGNLVRQEVFVVHVII